MAQKYRALLVATVAAASCLTGCQSSVTTQTTFARPYETTSLTKIFVIESLFGALQNHMDHGYEEFQANLTKGLQECGVSSEFYRIDNTPLALDTETKRQAALAAANKFGSDAILVVNETSMTTTSNGHVSDESVSYSFDLTDAKTRQGIWSARSTLYVHWNAGPKLAESALANMKEAAVLRDCAPSKGPS
ncbi:MAG TPA: hypothetical protein VGF92_04585 [Stellaceae bacterium]